MLVSAYAPASSLVSQKTSAAFLSSRPVTIQHPKITTRMYALLPNGGTELVDMHHALDHVLQSTSTFLSDSAAIAAENDDGGWWETYIQFYKNALIAVHSTIDQPLRNAGWDQTWGVSIALFTAGVRSLLLPLSIQQTKQSEFIKALKPYQDEIKEKFKDNKNMLNRATAKLYEDAKTNPFAGCLVSLAQLPILLGLYRSITRLAKEGSLQEPFLWIPSLEGPVSAENNYRGMEWLTQGWVDGVPSMGWEQTLAFCIMPVVLVLGQKVTMSVLTPSDEDEDTSKMSDEDAATADRTKTILKFLPLLIGYFSLQVPAGLTIYWFTTNVFTLTQSLIIRGYYKANPPNIELPDYWDALDNVEEMSPEDRREAAKAGVPVGPKWEDLVDEAKFHYVVERPLLRESSSSWNKATVDQTLTVPMEMEKWVASAFDSHSSTTSDNDEVAKNIGEQSTAMEPAQT